MAQANKKAFDLWGRRRIFPDPTDEKARERFISDNKKELELSEQECENNISQFLITFKRKPTAEEKYTLTHREPTFKEINREKGNMSHGIGRQGKNHRIQGSNSTIAKIAMGAGHCPEGKSRFLWHTLPLYNARLVKFVHDELVVDSPKIYAEQVAELIGDAFRRAALIKMKKVVMKFDYNVEKFWKK